MSKFKLWIVFALLAAALCAGCGEEMPVESAEASAAVTENVEAEDAFRPDMAAVYSVTGSQSVWPVYDPDVAAEYYEKYKGFVIGEEIADAELVSALRVVFEDGEKRITFLLNPEGCCGVFEEDGIHFYALEDGESIYRSFSDWHKERETEGRFMADSVSVSRDGRSVSVTDEVWWIFGQYRTLDSIRLAEEPEGLEQVELLFTDDDHEYGTRGLWVYENGCFSPEPAEGRTRYWYSASDGMELYHISMAHLNAAYAEAEAGSALIVLKGAQVAELYYSAEDAVSLNESVSWGEAAFRLSEQGRFERLYLLNVDGDANTLRNGEGCFAMLADAVVTDPAELERLFSLTQSSYVVLAAQQDKEAWLDYARSATIVDIQSNVPETVLAQAEKAAELAYEKAREAYPDYALSDWRIQYACMHWFYAIDGQAYTLYNMNCEFYSRAPWNIVLGHGDYVTEESWFALAENCGIYLLAQDQSGECLGYLTADENEIYSEDFIQRLRTLMG